MSKDTYANGLDRLVSPLIALLSEADDTKLLATGRCKILPSIYEETGSASCSSGEVRTNVILIDDCILIDYENIVYKFPNVDNLLQWSWHVYFKTSDQIINGRFGDYTLVYSRHKPKESYSERTSMFLVGDWIMPLVYTAQHVRDLKDSEAVEREIEQACQRAESFGVLTIPEKYAKGFRFDAKIPGDDE